MGTLEYLYSNSLYSNSMDTLDHIQGRIHWERGVLGVIFQNLQQIMETGAGCFILCFVTVRSWRVSMISTTGRCIAKLENQT